MTISSHLPRSGLVLLLINAILSTCLCALILAAFCHTDWAHTEFPYLPGPPFNLNYQTYIGPWRQCDVGRSSASDDTNAPINPSSGQCSDPRLINDKVQAFRAFLVISLFFSLVAMILHWVRFFKYAANKLVTRGFDITVIIMDVITVVAMAIVMGLVPYILDDIQDAVALATARVPAIYGGPATADYGNSAIIWIASLCLGVVLMFSQIIGYFAILRRVDYDLSANSAHTVKGAEMQPNHYNQNVVADTTVVDSRV